MAITPIERPSRFRLTYAFELVAVDGSGRGANRVLNFPVNPERINVQTNAGAEATFTSGGVALEESGFLVRDVTISGTTGLEPKRGWRLEKSDPHKPETGLTYRDGNVLFDELAKWFEFYWRLKRRQDVSAKWMMVFHDFRRARHWVILPQSFDSDRDARRYRLHYPYEIRFRAVADYDALEPTGVAGFFAKAREIGDIVNGAILDIAGYVADAEAFVAEANASLVGPLLETVGAVREVADGLAGVATGVRNLAVVPRRFVINTRRIIDGINADILRPFGMGAEGSVEADEWFPGNSSASKALAVASAGRSAESACDAVLAQRSLWSEGLGDGAERRAGLARGEGALEADELEDEGALGLGTRVSPGSGARATQRRLASSGTPRPAYSGVREYVVQSGETLREIAVRELGDGAWWIEIAELNGLRSPYVSRAGLPNTVMPGARILLPTLGVSADTTAGELSRDIEADALGVNWLLDEGGDLVSNGARNGFELVRGMAAYVQGLERVRFRTKLGDNPVWPDVGILAPVGDRNGQGQAAAIALSVRRACLTDPRTESVEDLEVVDEGDGASVVVQVQPRALYGPVTVRRGLE